MRKGILIGVVLVAVLAIFVVSRQSKVERPCRKLMQACQAGGYKRGQTAQERRAFYLTCLKPLMENASVGEVQVTPKEASACRERFTQRIRQQDGEA